MNVILFGLKASGQNTIGLKLKARLNYQFIDTDERIERYYEGISGKAMAFSDIYSECGMDVFRELERKVIDNIVKVKHHKDILLSVGEVL